MAEARRFRDEAPYQLWAALGCNLGREVADPISAALEEAKRLTAQQRAGILRLSECRAVGAEEDT